MLALADLCGARFVWEKVYSAKNDSREAGVTSADHLDEDKGVEGPSIVKSNI